MFKMAWLGVLTGAIVGFLSLSVVSSSRLKDSVSANRVQPEAQHVVTTALGSIQGVEQLGITGKKVIAYLGIPYAEPPVGQFRFLPPIPRAEPFKVIFNANKEPNACFQSGPEKLLRLLRQMGFYLNRPFSEDCLYLNVYVPEDCPPHASVIFYIHGGGFFAGSSTAFGINGATLASEEQVIVVTINYRLGVLGFLSLNHEEAPGNMGLMDQQLALKYVHDNIAAFGGNPNDVTLAGCSVGSASVGYQILSPGSHGLFQKVIMQSGVPTNPWAYGSTETVVKTSFEVAINLGYRGEADPASVAAYLRALDPDDVIDGNHFTDLISENLILPTVDGIFLPKDPDHAIMDAAEKQNITIMIGATSDEGAVLALMTHPDLFFRYEDNAINFYEYEQIVRHLGFGDDETMAIVANYVQNEKKRNPHYVRKLATETVGDYLFFCDIEEYADFFADRGFKVYRYVFDGKPTKQFALMPDWVGSSHGTDGAAFFGQYLIPEPTSANHSQVDLVFSAFNQQMLKRYGSFVKTGNPNPSADVVQWPAYNTDHGETMVLAPENDHVTHFPRNRECSIFRTVVPLVETFTNCKRSRGKLANKFQHHDGEH